MEFPKRIKNIAVFCGSSIGKNPAIAHAALEIGTILASNQIELTYGGANIGLMKILADSVINQGGHTIGVLPKGLVDKEIAHSNLHQLHIVENMRERKAMIFNLADAFILLPGGFGSLDEFFEVLTEVQVGMHQKPCAILNIDGYYDDLINMINKMLDQELLYHRLFDHLIIDIQSQELLQKILSYQPIEKAEKFISTLIGAIETK